MKDQKGQKDQLRIQLLCQELAQLQKEPNSVSLICQAFEEAAQEDFVINFSKLLKLPPAQEILLGLSLAHSLVPSVREEGIRHLTKKLGDLSEATLRSLPENTLYNLVYLLKTLPQLSAQAEIVSKQIEKIENLNFTILPLLNNMAST